MWFGGGGNTTCQKRHGKKLVNMDINNVGLAFKKMYKSDDHVAQCGKFVNTGLHTVHVCKKYHQIFWHLFWVKIFKNTSEECVFSPELYHQVSLHVLFPGLHAEPLVKTTNSTCTPLHLELEVKQKEKKSCNHSDLSFCCSTAFLQSSGNLLTSLFNLISDWWIFNNTETWQTLNKFYWLYYLSFLILLWSRKKGGQYCFVFFVFFSWFDVVKVGWFPNKLHINIHPDKSPTFIFLHFRFSLISITAKPPLSTFWGILYNILKSRQWGEPQWNTNYLSSLCILVCEVRLLCFQKRRQ